MSTTGHPWWLAPATALGAVMLRLVALTWRIEQRDHPEFTAARARGEKVLYCFWHSGMLPLIHSHRGEGIAVLVSQHRDGELVTRLIEHNGFVTARGSSTRGAETGVRELLRHARAGRDLGITPDGPRGPAEELKDGMVFLASRLQLPIVFIASASNRAWIARSWDRFRVPKPFAKVCISHGPPVRVPRDLDAQAIVALHQELARDLRSLTADVRTRAGEVL